MSEDGLPILPHTTAEFYAWLWWTSELQEAAFSLEEVGNIELWIDERLGFREPNDSKITALMTGDHPSTTLEARAALAGGKALNELRIGLRRDDREFSVTLKGPAMYLQRVKLPEVMTEGVDERLYDRMFLYEELCYVLQALFREYTRLRTSDEWAKEVLPQMQRWIVGQV
mgnify:CR=1 FL=1